MNILIFSWRGPKHPHFGGAEIVTHEHAKFWVKNGHKVTLFTSGFQGAKSEELLDGVKVVRRGKEILSVQIEAYKWYKKNSHQKFDLIIDQFHGIPFFTPLFTSSKKIAFIHEVTKEIWFLNHLPVLSRYVFAILGRVAEPWIFKLFYKDIPFMTVSNSTKKDLIYWGIPERNISVILNGVHTIKISKVKKEKDPTLIFLGSVSRDKGIEEALVVFSKVIDQIPNLKFWVVGKASEEYLSVLKEKIKRLGIEENVKFWGFVSDKKKFKLLFKSHILLNPSVREGWGLVVLEAASMGVPTVAFDVPGLRDSILNNKTGILCKYKDLDKMADQMTALFLDPARIKRLSRGALDWSRGFKWESSTKKSLALIKKVVK